MTSITRHYREVSKVLRKSALPDPYFVTLYSFSPYMACEHACKYCDGRAEKYHVEGNYEKDIVIRKNMIEILSAELNRIKEPGFISIGSGISDPYQQVEADEKLLSQTAKLIYETDFPVSVHTKSTLILRDLDLWQQVNQKNGFILFVSLNSLKEQQRQIFEPGAASIQERLEMIRSFREKHIPVGILAMPILPFINDSRDDLEDLFHTLKMLKVNFILPGTLTLRPGIQKETYLNVVREFYPDLTAKYHQLYRDNLASGNPDYDYCKSFFLKIAEIIKEKEIPMRVPHNLYHRKFSPWDEIYILLKHMEFLYGQKGIEIRNLKKSTTRYQTWLKSFHRNLSRRGKKRFMLTLEEFPDFMNSPAFSDIIDNDRLTDFLKKIILSDQIFDYQKLALAKGEEHDPD